MVIGLMTCLLTQVLIPVVTLSTFSRKVLKFRYLKAESGYWYSFYPDFALKEVSRLWEQ